MSRYKNGLAQRDSHIMSLRVTICILCLVIGAMWYGWKSAPDNLTITNPPDLRSGSTRAWWEIEPSAVYAFAFYVFQQLNHWPTDGEVDYKRNIKALKHFFTPSCSTFLERDYENRRILGELKGRSRGVGEIPGRGYLSEFVHHKTHQLTPRVQIRSRDNWLTTFDLFVDEYYQGESVKRTLVRYPLNIVRADTNPELNPWGLLIDCYEGTPLRLVSNEYSEE